jgi:hypothetical protein
VVVVDDCAQSCANSIKKRIGTHFWCVTDISYTPVCNLWERVRSMSLSDNWRPIFHAGARRAARDKLKGIKMMPAEAPVTVLLRQLSQGNQAAFDALMPMVYDQLRKLATQCLSSERRDHTLAATALVHEALSSPGRHRYRLAESRAFLRHSGPRNAAHSGGSRPDQKTRQARRRIRPFVQKTHAA